MNLNKRRIIFSAIVTGVLGTGLGYVISYIFPSPFHGWTFYQNLDRKYMIGGAVAGALLGASQESIRQLKKETDRQDDEQT
jgi:hypothetical protein